MRLWPYDRGKTKTQGITYMYRHNDILTWSSNGSVYVTPDLSDVRYDNDWALYYKQRSVRHDHYAHKADLDLCVAVYPVCEIVEDTKLRKILQWIRNRR